MTVDASSILAEDAVARNFSEALESEDPYEALMAMSAASSLRAQKLSHALDVKLTEFVLELPELLVQAAKKNSSDNNPLTDATACADSILHSLTKIASGGSEASQDIRRLELEKRDLEQHAQDVETALILRKNSDLASDSVNSQKYDIAASAIERYRELKQWDRINDRARAYAGEYTLQQLDHHQRVLKKTLLEHYEIAVQQADLQRLGHLTPLLPKIELEQEAVSLYLRYLNGVTSNEFAHSLQSEASRGASGGAQPPSPPYVLMARVYNCAVTMLRHHLPMVSHCLCKANGDAAVAQLVHVQVEKNVIPIFQKYVQTRELATVSRAANRIYDLLEDRYSGRGMAGDDDDLLDGSGDGRDGDPNAGDCGFSSEVGTLADVDAAMEEAALCLQHTESYTRFMGHTVHEINKARELRFKREQDQRRMERERQEWATGMSGAAASEDSKEEDEEPYRALEILPPCTQLQEVVAEVGGYYSGIERCLLLASMQRGFVAPDSDPRYFTPLGMQGNPHAVSGRAMQTTLIETCFYAARRSTQRAFATGHTGTASAMANFCSDVLGGVLLQVLSQRVEDAGVHRLKPGEGLLVGSAGLFHNVKLIRQAGHTINVKSNVATPKQKMEEADKKRHIQLEIAKACATFNDLEVAAHHTQQLESVLSEAIDNGFPPGHDTEQLRMCVKSLSPVTEGFKLASNTGVDSLVEVLKSRIRSIVTEVAGPEGGASSATFMGTMGGGKGGDRVMVHMNYDLDDESYQLMQLSEGYMGRLCTLIDELISPVQPYLAPRLWDALVIGVFGFACKRLEASLRKCQFTALGALSLDSDMRDFLSHAKDLLDSPELRSNMALYRACVPLARLMQISRLLNVDDLEDVLDLISSSKRKANWDLKLDDAKAFLCLRAEFSGGKVNELLRIDDD